MSNFKFHRGVYVIDKLTGFKGVISARTDSITGCNRYAVQPDVDKDGKYVDSYWIDEHSLEIDTTKQQLKLYREESQPPG